MELTTFASETGEKSETGIRGQRLDVTRLRQGYGVARRAEDR
jgi:hypothetical protein